jgi:hypothetical protein
MALIAIRPRLLRNAADLKGEGKMEWSSKNGAAVCERGGEKLSGGSMDPSTLTGIDSRAAPH